MSNPETRRMAGLTPEDPAKKKDKLRTEPNSAAMPVNSPRIRANADDHLADGDNGPSTGCAVFSIHSRKSTYQL
jgi:hypothetical protein